MTKRILVPLDGTPTAEAVLPVVADLARSAGSTVRLLHVKPVPGNVESQAGRVVAYADQEMTRLEAEGLTHLESLEALLAGVPVECIVRFGDPGREILLEAEAFGADIVALTTTGRSWLRRIFRGGVAARVLRKAKVPVLVFRT